MDDGENNERAASQYLPNAQPLSVPPSLRGLRGSSEGRVWLDRLPSLVAECADQWSLTLEPPFPYAYTSIALPAVLATGNAAVLKIQFPHRESEQEAAALARWDGEGAVRLLAHDPRRHALLLERCEPGTPLSELDEETALDVMLGLLPRLWKPAGEPFRSLTAEARRWAYDLVENWDRLRQPFERELIDAARDALAGLTEPQKESMLLHQDLHAGNVLSAQREPWLVIDPKPLVGEREFSIAALVRGDELGRGPDHIRYGLDRLTAELNLDREKALGWSLAHTLAWSMEGDEVFADQVEVARWLLDLK